MREEHLKKERKEGFHYGAFYKEKYTKSTRLCLVRYHPRSSRDKYQFSGEEGERKKMASRDYTNIGEKYYESLRYLSFSNSYLAQFILGTGYSRFTLDEWKS